MTFWKKVTDLLNDKGGETSLVILEYSEFYPLNLTRQSLQH
jgi:hypothetical protein